MGGGAAASLQMATPDARPQPHHWQVPLAAGVRLLPDLPAADKELFTTDKELFMVDKELFTADEEIFAENEEIFVTDEEVFATDPDLLAADATDAPTPAAPGPPGRGQQGRSAALSYFAVDDKVGGSRLAALGGEGGMVQSLWPLPLLLSPPSLPP